MTLFAAEKDPTGKPTSTTTSGRGEGGGGTAMRIIVPLQGVVQGRGGLFFGSVIPCALFYFLQLYLRRNRSKPEPDNNSSNTNNNNNNGNSSSPEEVVLGLERTFSRTHLSPRGPSGLAHLSSRASRTSETPYFVGLSRVAEDPFDELDNPDGVVQLGLAENKVGSHFSFILF
uniref:Uncharacterized protein n=1 Tax=Opuntia streptacantha TaxID=393608 RepID=A0A7C9ET58_OPUST